MRTLAHRKVQRRIDALLDGELPTSDEAALGRHLVECPDCARHALLTARVKQVLRSLAERC